MEPRPAATAEGSQSLAEDAEQQPDKGQACVNKPTKEKCVLFQKSNKKKVLILLGSLMSIL